MKRAKPDHVKKLTALFEQYPDGLNMRQIQTELQTSPHNAQAALDELGAVKAGAKWLLPDDDEAARVEVAPGAKADTAVVNENFTTELGSTPSKLPTTEPLQDLHGLPTTKETQLVGNPDQLHIMSLDTSDVDALRKIYERSAPQVIIGSEPKQIGQSVFDGLPSEIMWAAVDSHGTCLGFRKPPIISAGCYKQNVRVGDVENPIFIGWPFDNTNWMDSIIQRESFIDEWGIENFQKECERTPTENPVDPYQPVKAPSDYSPVFNNILGRVLQIIKTYGGATADRVHELTGMHPDDIADAVQYMVDHGQLVGSPLYFTTVYEVAA